MCGAAHIPGPLQRPTGMNGFGFHRVFALALTKRERRGLCLVISTL